jgi:hypothetical protein
MKLFTGWVISAGLVLCVAGANAQTPAPYGLGNSPYRAASDFGGPYAAMPEEAPEARYAPMLIPPQEVYAIVRESGFSPLGIPQQRGFVYTIAVIDQRGEDGRLVIDARTGRILRFMPAWRMGDNFNTDAVGYGPAAPLPPISHVRGAPRPPLSIPRVASRSTPMPRPSPLAARTDSPPAERSASIAAKPPEAPAPQNPAQAAVQPKPAAAQIQPTQEMPKAQGLD